MYLRYRSKLNDCRRLLQINSSQLRISLKDIREKLVPQRHDAQSDSELIDFDYRTATRKQNVAPSRFIYLFFI